jgi:diguanylate cyclase (GGDEF)-like protein/PAS domain S-box-containing protein
MANTGQAEVIYIEQRLQKRLQTVLNAMPIAVSWADLRTQRIEFVNSKFTALFGYEPAELGTVDEWISNVYPNPEHTAKARSMWLPYFGGNASETVEIPQFEVDVRCKDGSVRTTLLGGAILPEAGWALATFVDITDRKRSEERIERLALEDPLTGLPNRRAFQRVLRRALARALRQGARMALVLIDVDGLKPVNDSFGHDRGDLLLRSIAERLSRVVRGADLVCRIGGDEFGVVLDGIPNAAAAEEVAARMVAEASKPLIVETDHIPASVSVGIAVFPQDADTEETLYKKADIALYQSKKSGGNRWTR